MLFVTFLILNPSMNFKLENVKLRFSGIIDTKFAIARNVNQTDTAICGQMVKDLVYSSRFSQIFSNSVDINR